MIDRGHGGGGTGWSEASKDVSASNFTATVGEGKRKLLEEEDQGHLVFTSSHPRPNSSWDNFTILVHDTTTCHFHNQLDLTCIAFT